MKSLLVDCETTGLVENRTVRDEKLPEVIELYACLADIETQRIHEELDVLIKPTRLPLDPKVKRITGITEEMLDDKLAFRFYADRFEEMVKEADCVIAHNCSFDTEVLEIEFKRLGRTVTWPRKICTVEQTIHVQGKRLSLGALHEYLFGEKFDGAHRARVDVMALMRCASELMRREMI